jgi:hypothetical protein
VTPAGFGASVPIVNLDGYYCSYAGPFSLQITVVINALSTGAQMATRSSSRRPRSEVKSRARYYAAPGTALLGCLPGNDGYSHRCFGKV